MPMMAPTVVCVVDTGRPSQHDVLSLRTQGLPSSAGRADLVCSWLFLVAFLLLQDQLRTRMPQR
jgi:hypothetical protein